MHPTQGRTRGVRLRDLLPDSQICGDADVHVSSLCSTSQDCRPGDLFVAVTGADSDGHDEVEDAVRRGASAVLAERLLPVDVPVCVVSDSRETFGELCQAMAGKPSQKLCTLGVTGSQGKTTTAILLGSILEAAGGSLGVVSDLGCSDGKESSSFVGETPTTTEYAHWMKRMVDNGCSYSVLEMSSQSLAQRHTSGIELDAAILTPVRRAHLDLHGSILNYHRAKSRIFQQLKTHGVVIANADDPVSMRLTRNLSHPVLTYGLHAEADVTARVVERHLSEQTILLTAARETVPVRTQMVGDHHIYNCLAAAAAGMLLGVDLTSTARGLERVTSIPGRLERIECGQPFGVFFDCGRTADALAATVNTLKRVTTGRLICVLDAGDDVAAEVRPLLGRILDKVAQVAVITGGGKEARQPLRNVHDVLDGYQRPGKAHVLPNRSRAIAWALAEAEAGDTVLITGRAPEKEWKPGGRRGAAREVQIAQRWLYSQSREETAEAAPHGLRILREAR